VLERPERLQARNSTYSALAVAERPGNEQNIQLPHTTCRSRAFKATSTHNLRLKRLTHCCWQVVYSTHKWWWWCNSSNGNSRFFILAETGACSLVVFYLPNAVVSCVPLADFRSRRSTPFFFSALPFFTLPCCDPLGLYGTCPVMLALAAPRLYQAILRLCSTRSWLGATHSLWPSS
jgi:hypothetical protein